MNIEKIAIIDSSTGRPVSLEEWKKVEDPEIAEWILVETDELRPFLVGKDLLDGGKVMTWHEAVASGAAPTRAQALALYDARFAGLDEAIALLAGTPLQEITWTRDEDKDPDCASNAWYVTMYAGYVNYYAKSYGNRVRPVSAFNPSDL